MLPFFLQNVYDIKRNGWIKQVFIEKWISPMKSRAGTEWNFQALCWLCCQMDFLLLSLILFFYFPQYSSLTINSCWHSFIWIMQLKKKEKQYLATLMAPQWTDSSEAVKSLSKLMNSLYFKFTFGFYIILKCWSWYDFRYIFLTIHIHMLTFFVIASET